MECMGQPIFMKDIGIDMDLITLIESR